MNPLREPRIVSDMIHSLALVSMLLAAVAVAPPSTAEAPASRREVASVDGARRQLQSLSTVHGGGINSTEGNPEYEAYKRKQSGKLNHYIQAGNGTVVSKMVLAIDQAWVTKIPTEYDAWGLKSGVVGQSVLCLGARLGGEVRAFTEMGALSLGIDLNPGPSNKYVLIGDFHHLQFASHVFDLVYTNVIGHAWDLRALGSEICRVLKPSGVFHMDARGDASNETTISRDTTAIHGGKGYGSLAYTRAPHLASRMGMAVVSEPQHNFIVCRCK